MQRSYACVTHSILVYCLTIKKYFIYFMHKKFFAGIHVNTPHVCGSAFLPCCWGVGTPLGQMKWEALGCILPCAGVRWTQPKCPSPGEKRCRQTEAAAGVPKLVDIQTMLESTRSQEWGSVMSLGLGERRGNSSLAQGVSVWEHRGAFFSMALYDKGFPLQAMTVSLDERGQEPGQE